MTADLSSETDDGRQSHLRNLYPVKIAFKNEDEITTFSDRRKLGICSSALQEMLKEIPQAEGSVYQRETQYSVRKKNPLEIANICVSIKDYYSSL